MDELIGKEVKHPRFGYGRIKNIKNNYIEVVFAGQSKIFQYPQAFETYLQIQDSAGADYVRKILRDSKLAQ